MALQAGAATTLGRLLAMQGDFEQARDLYASGQDFYQSAGMAVSAAGITLHGAWIEHHAGDPTATEEISGRVPTNCRSWATGRSSRRSPCVSLNSCTSRAASRKPETCRRSLARATPATDDHQLRVRGRHRRLSPVPRRSARGSGGAARSRGGGRGDHRLLLRAGGTSSSCMPRCCLVQMSRSLRLTRQRSLSLYSIRRVTSPARLALVSASK